jgi:hypothetical protein
MNVGSSLTAVSQVIILKVKMGLKYKINFISTYIFDFIKTAKGIKVFQQSTHRLTINVN